MTRTPPLPRARLWPLPAVANYLGLTPDAFTKHRGALDTLGLPAPILAAPARWDSQALRAWLDRLSRLTPDPCHHGRDVVLNITATDLLNPVSEGTDR